MNNRTARVASQIQREVSDIIRTEIKDSRIPALISILRVEVSGDLEHAKLFVSTYSSKEEGAAAAEALNGAAGFIRKLLGARMKLRVTPQLHFVFDDSIEYSVHISEILSHLNTGGEEK
ncbi:MAG: 30S ribosome-binding factor RbfA [Eubacteriales bacterium]|nr:30S ribosome-binding factor RbfA [Eubacteriales bacterium]